ncbi:hypothetical protein NLG97_g5342 [Lecanicillium saksenae]|uniref:Uncharacterized protein n=1 Tax=Lecanicillium saksenae TaxID=468837 RepID=A0ACC1QWK2_9HYPO|nr:hypothetical protein NLG97_g5342 [Lecanicillium saksenae]
MVTFISAINTTRGACPWLKQPIPCDFGLYTNATNLNESQKLLPNNEVTGHNIIIMFVATTYAAFSLSLVLLADESFLLYSKTTIHGKAAYQRLIHTGDTLLHSLSDSQIVVGLALLIVTTFHASCISAYHYNVVCYLMYLSVISHALTFINVPEFCSKNWLHGGVRALAITATFAFTWMLFKAREASDRFPIAADSLAIMPAACFVGNQSTVLRADLFASGNMSQIVGATGHGASSSVYSSQFVPLAVGVILGLLFLLGDSFKSRSEWLGEDSFVTARRVVVVLRGILTTYLLVLAIIATVSLFRLRTGFEIDSWYDRSQEDTASLSQIVILTMSTTSLFAIFSVIIGK